MMGGRHVMRWIPCREGLLAMLSAATIGGCAGEDSPVRHDLPPGGPPLPSFAEAMALPLQVRAADALTALRSLDTTDLSVRQKAVRNCMLDRFQGPDDATSALGDSSAAWPDRLVLAFRRYWRRSVLDPPDDAERRAGEREAALLHDIRRIVPGADGGRAATLDEMEPYVLKRLAEVGLHARMGITPPLRELLIWAGQDSRVERVNLPSGAEEVTVELMQDFRSSGWAHYATCGRSSAGGWVGDDRLFAVRDRYDLNSEDYRVSYLAHEAQHFRDRRLFGPQALAPWRMEYRAKLVELILADSTRSRLLRNFLADRSGEESLPHSHANDVLARALAEALALPDSSSDAERLLDADPGLVSGAAARLLEEDTKSLRVSNE